MQFIVLYTSVLTRLNSQTDIMHIKLPGDQLFLVPTDSAVFPISFA